MIKKVCGLFTAVCVSMSATVAMAQDLSELDGDTTAEYAQHLTEQFNKIEDHQVKVEVDPEKAVGLSDEMEGIIVVPAKDLKEGEPNEAVHTEQGAGLAYLFCSPRFDPIIDGKKIDAKKLRTFKYMDDSGIEKTATCMILAVRNVEGDDWRLYAYGAEKKPVIDAKFADAAEAPEGNLTIAVKDAKGKKQMLVVTLFGKYAAEFAIGH
ncbi:hypothetical protein CA54_07430 [Symmachiella macrocystis]|uniref:Uncharacterized protein n=1 Tax=Symmachiella macrocystis TaxID=2527985 RepID=A0A5C6BK52_9PLAN|nr:hypothetical protein [Symmachiella macrocystis]TWU11931.1 hypothetical protein CA54_07430 [Symmachiella macrocystis]